MVIQLAHNQSEYPMAKTANSQQSQTLQVESEHTLSTRFQKPSNAAEDTKQICS